MFLLYTHPDRLLVSHVRNVVSQNGIEVLCRNEYLGGAAGELSPFDTWLELWVRDQTSLQRATLIVNEMLAEDTVEAEITCPHCTQASPASFALCWHCNRPLPAL